MNNMDDVRKPMVQEIILQTLVSANISKEDFSEKLSARKNKLTGDLSKIETIISDLDSKMKLCKDNHNRLKKDLNEINDLIHLCS